MRRWLDKIAMSQDSTPRSSDARTTHQQTEGHALLLIVYAVHQLLPAGIPTIVMRVTTILSLVLAVAPSTCAVTPKLSVCTGSVCTRNGSPFVLEAALALACSTEQVEVRPTKCMSACRGKYAGKLAGVAAFASLSKSKVVMDASDGPSSAAKAVSETFSELGIAASELMLDGVESKLAGDAAMASDDPVSALAAYSTALAALPPAKLEAFIADASEAAATNGAPPPRLTGLPPSRAEAAALKERERTMPGDVRWLFEALIGRARARLLLGLDVDDALSDARDAPRLCPLAPAGWESLQAAAEAAGEVELAEVAAAEAERRRPS